MQKQDVILEQEFVTMYADIDKNLEMTNVSLLRYLQELGGLQTKKIFGSMITPKGVWILLNWKVKRFKEIKWSEHFKIKTWPAKHTSVFSIRNYEVYNEDGERVAIASTRWVLMDLNTKKLVRDITDVVEKYSEYEKMLFDEDFPRLKVPSNIEYKYNYTVQKRDIDTNDHVNNVKYLEIAYEALPDEVYEKGKFKNIDVMYKHSAFLGEELNIGVSKNICDGREEYVIVMKSNNNLNVIIRLS